MRFHVLLCVFLVALLCLSCFTEDASAWGFRPRFRGPIRGPLARLPHRRFIPLRNRLPFHPRGFRVFSGADADSADADVDTAAVDTADNEQFDVDANDYEYLPANNGYDGAGAMAEGEADVDDAEADVDAADEFDVDSKPVSRSPLPRARRGNPALKKGKRFVKPRKPMTPAKIQSLIGKLEAKKASASTASDRQFYQKKIDKLQQRLARMSGAETNDAELDDAEVDGAVREDEEDQQVDTSEFDNPDAVATVNDAEADVDAADDQDDFQVDTTEFDDPTKSVEKEQKPEPKPTPKPRPSPSRRFRGRKPKVNVRVNVNVQQPRRPIRPRPHPKK